MYTDYSGDDPSCAYECFAAYVADWAWRAPVVAGLNQLRRKRVIVERTLNYKNRKDGTKNRLARPWLAQFRRWPGLLLVWCVEKRASRRRRIETREYWKELQEEALKAFNWKLNPKSGDRLVNAVCPIGIIGHLLDSQMKLFWISDRDPIFDGKKKEHVSTVFQSLIEGVVKTPLKSFGFATCPPNQDEEAPEWELMLSLPDLAAGALAASMMEAAASGIGFKGIDEQTKEIVEALGSFSDATVAGAGTSCRLLVVGTFINPLTGALDTKVVHLKNKPPAKPV